MKDVKQARLILANFGGHPDCISGPQNKALRQRIYALLTGTKVAKNKCGVSALKSKIIEVSGIDQNSCIAVVNDRIIKWCMEA